MNAEKEKRPADIGARLSKGRLKVKDKNNLLEWIKAKHKSFIRLREKRNRVLYAVMARAESKGSLIGKEGNGIL